MFHFMDGDQQSRQDQDASCGGRLAGRIMVAEYNLAVQRGDTPQAASVLATMLGQFLSEKFSR